jgi:L-2,4-diaminobutyrate decarboxylase
MSIEQWAESFGVPDDVESVHRVVRRILRTVLRPTVPFEGKEANRFAVPRLSTEFGADHKESVSELLAEVASWLVPGAIHTRHPYAMAHMEPPPATISVLADLIIGAMNQCAFIWEEAPVASALEEESVTWLCKALGYGRDSGGILTSGGTTSNLLAMHLARQQAVAEERKRSELCVVATDQAHFSIEKAASITGIGVSAVVRIPTDSRGRLRPGRLSEWVVNLTTKGKIPFLLVCTAGTTNAGSLEPASEFCVVARSIKAWCHIDGAHGGVSCLSTEGKGSVATWAQADSVSWDPHKTLYASYSLGALLLRDASFLRHLRFGASYALSDENSRDAGLYHFEGSRRLEALKLWMLIRHFGISGYTELVDHSFNLAREFARRIRGSRDFMLLTDPDTNIVCFRFADSRFCKAELNKINEEIQSDLFMSGGPLLSKTQIQNIIYLRAVLLNPLLRMSDLDDVIERIREQTCRVTTRNSRKSSAWRKGDENQPRNQSSP